MKRLSRRTWALLVLAALAGYFGYRHWGSYAIRNANPAGRTIIAFGDSLTYGTGADDGQSYPDQLAQRIGVPIVNKGVPGDTTADALRRLDRDVLARNPKIVLVCLGGNDVLRQLDPDRSFQSLGQIITRTQDRGALVILLGLSGTPLNPGLGARYRALARRTGCPFVPNCLGGILGNPHLMSDQIHPNAAGYARMVDKVEPVLRKYLGR